ncbi:MULTISPECIES: glutaredoxin family protein [Halobacterium]|uniref:Glutaredoxin n=4 Tax=Halobacterium salinarum TaxID=2242 RepID=Q9HPN6_HALSA|nr:MULTISPECIES: glutaredoxin [Halobacterium]AAG19831.1 hypothetical protein VNG_1546H [Halobacterium salinarum NRC-1]MBB6088837.1 glutaredoxin [Halobacterium salinarum]MCF2166005.1 glutaredoxin [Halobacterium salinarum]MCF2167525.1 glutaredoxin [Halobacterium salinarum]MCF2207406.1 glutaredoxin [Halobacterium salinarum]
MTLTLYALDGCPDCESVIDTLAADDIDHETVHVDARHSARNAVKRASGQRSVPVLVDDDRGVVMADSQRIQTYAAVTLA